MDPSTPPSHQRLLTHLTTTHPSTLARLLEHHASAYDAQSPHLTALTPTSLTIAYTNGSASSYILHSSKTIPLSPPLASLSPPEVEARLLAMDAAAEAVIARGGRSELVIKAYRAPRGWQLVAAVWVACVVGAYALETRGSELLGLGERAGWWYRVGLGTAFWVLVVLHVGESVGVLLPMLWKYNVRVGTGVWWLWVGSHIVEGWGAIMRFRGIVREEEGRRAKEGKEE
ncbi:hypothetical protein MMC32_005123 [Xylographa parallela]|nr:hypothetical protein [Xylographa parallela]